MRCVASHAIGSASWPRVGDDDVVLADAELLAAERADGHGDAAGEAERARRLGDAVAIAVGRALGGAQTAVARRDRPSPAAASRPSGSRRQVRDTQSSDGDATTTSDGAGVSEPRSQMRPTGLLVHAPSERNPSTTNSRGEVIGADNKEPDTASQANGYRHARHDTLVRRPGAIRSSRLCATGMYFGVSPRLDTWHRHVDDFAACRTL